MLNSAEYVDWGGRRERRMELHGHLMERFLELVEGLPAVVRLHAK
jgi:hypothetical protein